MLISAAEVMRERGAAGVTIDEVLARSGAPRGSVYYHFPEGRNQILTEALQYAGEAHHRRSSTKPPPSGGMYLVRQFVEFWERPARRERLHRRLPRGRRGDRLCRRRAAADHRRGQHLRPLARRAHRRVRQRRLRRALTPRRWPSRASPRWRVRSCCAGPPAVSTRCVDVAAQVEFLIKSREFVRRYGLPLSRQPTTARPCATGRRRSRR